MGALAKFIMASRTRAALVACLGNLLPLLSPAVVALVVLRKGFGEGLLIGLWAILPLLAAFYFSDMAPVLIWASLATVGVVIVVAMVLKGTASWQAALAVLVVTSGGTALMLGQGLGAELAGLQQRLAEMLARMTPDGQGVTLSPQPLLLLGMVAWMIAISALGSLLLGRWWQALLYNPGGLGLEFRSLRIRSPWGLVLMAGVVACQLAPVDYSAWGNLLGLPLFLGGIALVHHVVAVSHVGVHWLAVFYVCLVVLLGPLGLLLIGVGLLDSLIDVRARIARRGDGTST
jgi:hypothetical protein